MRTRTRHLWGLLLGIIGAPALFAAVTAGVALAGRGGDVLAVRVAFGALGVAALLTVILAAPRVSPIASLLAGLVLVALGALVAVPGADPAAYMRRWLPPAEITLGSSTAPPVDQMAVTTLGTGAFALVGGILLLASLAPTRWRSRAVTLDEPLPEAEEPVEEPWMPALPSGAGDHVEEPPSNVSPVASRSASDGL